MLNNTLLMFMDFIVIQHTLHPMDPWKSKKSMQMKLIQSLH